MTLAQFFSLVRRLFPLPTRAPRSVAPIHRGAPPGPSKLAVSIQAAHREHVRLVQSGELA